MSADLATDSRCTTVLSAFKIATANYYTTVSVNLGGGMRSACMQEEEEEVWVREFGLFFLSCTDWHM